MIKREYFVCARRYSKNCNAGEYIEGWLTFNTRSFLPYNNIDWIMTAFEEKFKDYPGGVIHITAYNRI